MTLNRKSVGLITCQRQCSVNSWHSGISHTVVHLPHNLFYRHGLFTFSSITELKTLMNKCLKYLQTWRFSFNVIKSKCVVIGKSVLNAKPDWNLGTQIMDTVESVNILGTIFQSSAKSETHIEERMKACRCTTRQAQSSCNYIQCSRNTATANSCSTTNYVFVL